MNRCVDCGMEVGRTSKRCRSCNGKWRWQAANSRDEAVVSSWMAMTRDPVVAETRRIAAVRVAQQITRDRICVDCGGVFPGRTSAKRCTGCAEIKKIARRVAARYRITPDDLTKRLEEYNGCEICRRFLTAQVDHDHRTGIVRGLLCRDCNTGLGLFEEDVERMKNAISYLERSTRG